MSKYEKINSRLEHINMDDVLVDGETLIWQGKPKKSAFIINKSITMLPIALLWGMIDGGFIAAIIASGEIGEMWWFIIPFFALHLMPVWIWLGNVLSAGKKWANTRYVMTDRRIIIESGFIGMDYQTIYYKDINKVNLKVGAIDKLLKVGDIYFDIKNGVVQAFLDLEDAYDLYPKIQKVVLDMQTDIEFPNNLRPEENDGYKTKYNSNF